jgi:beta-xylosidase
MTTPLTPPRRTRHAAAHWLLAVLIVALLLGCDQQSSPTATVPAPTATTAAVEATPTTAQQPTATTARATATTVAATATVVVPEGEFLNPVLQQDFPDPGVINVNGTYYAYATNSNGVNIQAATSPDLVAWTMLPDAMPVLPSWANPEFGFAWAPEVIDLNGRYVMYYTARKAGTSSQCIGVATSDKPEGPFKDTNEQPFICQVEAGGSIDPSPFRDGDKLYLYWKNDGNCCGSITYIYEQELAPDGLSLVGEPNRLVSNDARWEGTVVEAPTMWKQEGKYYLFFSANAYNTINYAVGYATCDSPTGPCKDAPENPILKTETTKPPALGPGHQTVVLDKDGETWFVYHVWAVPVGGKLEKRFMWLDSLTWEEGKPHVHGPTKQPQPKP